MACARGNAHFVDVVASDCSKKFVEFMTQTLDPLVDQLIIYSTNPTTMHLGHFRTFSLRHFVIVSFSIKVTFSSMTPTNHTTTSITLPLNIRVKQGTTASSPTTIRYTTNGTQRTSMGLILADGTELDENEEVVNNDQIKISTFGRFSPGVTYELKGQLQIEPVAI